MSLTSRSAASFVILSAAAVATTFGGCGQLFPSAMPAGVGGSTGDGVGGSQGGDVGGSSGTGTVMKDSSNYPQNTAGAAFPYPQGHAFAHCALPVYDTDKVATAYTNWKTKFYQGGRVVRPENGNDTASEGIAYGMLIAVYMNDRAMFDTLWGYAQARLNGNGLMTWHYSSSGSVVEQGGATDADQDMAWALLMANKQWGAASYLSAATTLIGNIFSHEVDQGNGFVLKPGDMFGGANQTNPSYFAPSYYRVFARVTGNTGWMNRVEHQLFDPREGGGELWAGAELGQRAGDGSERAGQRRQQRRLLRVRRLPHAVADRARLLRERRSQRHGLSAEGRRVLRLEVGHRRAGGDPRRLHHRRRDAAHQSDHARAPTLRAWPSSGRAAWPQ